MPRLIDPEKQRFLFEAREELEPFRDWLVRSQGYIVSEADVVVAVVCRAVWESAEGGGEPDPVAILDRNLNRWAWYRIRRALRLYYAWMLGCDRFSHLQPYVSCQLSRLTVLRCHVPQGEIVTPKRTVPPIGQEIFLATLRGLHKWSLARGRSPWVWSVLSIKLKLGCSWPDILAFSKENMVRAVAGERTGTLPLSRRTTATRVTKRSVPVALISDEISLLIKWPWEWTYVADIVLPRGRISLDRLLNSYLKTCFPEEFTNNRRGLKARLVAAARCWMLKKLKGDWIMLGQITGQTQSYLQTRPELLVVSAETS